MRSRWDRELKTRVARGLVERVARGSVGPWLPVAELPTRGLFGEHRKGQDRKSAEVVILFCSVRRVQPSDHGRNQTTKHTETEDRGVKIDSLLSSHLNKSRLVYMLILFISFVSVAYYYCQRA